MKKLLYLLSFGISSTTFAQAEIPQKMMNEPNDIISPKERNRVDNKIGTALISDNKKEVASNKKTVPMIENKSKNKQKRHKKSKIIRKKN